MVYVGMDVHRKRTQVAILQEDGTEILNRNVPNNPAELSPLLGTLESGTPVVFEVAYGWGWLAELLEEWDPPGPTVSAYPARRRFAGGLSVHSGR